MNRNHAIRTIHGCARAAGLDDESKRDAYQRAVGKRSLKLMTDDEIGTVADAMRAKAPKRSRWRAPEPKAHVRKVLKIWWLLAQAGAVKPGRPALNAFIRNEKFRAKWGEALTDVAFLSVERARDVIEALKAIAAREGVKDVR